MTLTFELDDILFGHGRCIHPKWSEVSMIKVKKKGNNFIDISILAGTITAKRGP